MGVVLVVCASMDDTKRSTVAGMSLWRRDIVMEMLRLMQIFTLDKSLHRASSGEVNGGVTGRVECNVACFDCYLAGVIKCHKLSPTVQML